MSLYSRILDKMEEEKKEPKYEDIVKRMRDNLDNFESFYFAALMKSGEHGAEGQRDGLYASLWGLREKVGLEGILSVLEAQGKSSIEGGNGLNSEFSLGSVIKNTAGIFLESAFELKVRDLIPYIKERVDVEIEERYGNIQLKNLLKSEEDKEKETYGRHLLSELRNAVMAKVVPISYRERAKDEEKKYLREHPK